MSSARCPRCHRPTQTTSNGPHRWYCHACRMEFEDVDDGDYSDRNPAARIEREERRETTRRNGGRPRE